MVGHDLDFTQKVETKKKLCRQRAGISCDRLPIFERLS